MTRRRPFRPGPGNRKRAYRRWNRVAARREVISAGARAAAAGRPGGRRLRRETDALHDYAKRTWASFAAMTDRSSGLPADILESDGSRSVQTSTTNIGAYMWSAVAARRLGLLSRSELVARLSRTITTLERMERYADTGQYYNWYDHRTGAKLTVWPPRPEDDVPPHPVLGRQRLAGRRPEDRRAHGAAARPARAGALQGDGLRLLLRARAQPGALPLPPRRSRCLALLLRHRGQRESDRRLHRDRARPAAATRPTTGAGARSPTPATTPSRRRSR